MSVSNIIMIPPMARSKVHPVRSKENNISPPSNLFQQPHNTRHMAFTPIIKSQTISLFDTPIYPPRTPGLATPRMVLRSGAQSVPVSTIDYSYNGPNPWIVRNPDSNTNIKITGITPIGTIAEVPTNFGKGLQTPRCAPRTPAPILTRKLEEENSDDDPLLTATIYLNNTDRDDKYVANKMRTITEHTMNLQKQYTNYYMEMPDISGDVDNDTFEELLLIYENNQVYYQDQIEDGTMSFTIIKQKLIELEEWFMTINEPKPLDADEYQSWVERCQFKKEKGITMYCDPELYRYLN